MARGEGKEGADGGCGPVARERAGEAAEGWQHTQRGSGGRLDGLDGPGSADGGRSRVSAAEKRPLFGKKGQYAVTTGPEGPAGHLVGKTWCCWRHQV